MYLKLLFFRARFWIFSLQRVNLPLGQIYAESSGIIQKALNAIRDDLPKGDWLIGKGEAGTIYHKFAHLGEMK